MKLLLFPLSATVLVGIALIASACSQGTAKERKTVVQCRAYADAWQTSPEEDMRRFSVIF